LHAPLACPSCSLFRSVTKKSSPTIWIRLPAVRVKEASRAYLVQNDPIGRALQEAFVIDRSAQAMSAELYGAYVDWHARSAEPDDPMTLTAFGLALTARGFVKKRGRNGVVYAYIRPKSAMEVAAGEESDGASGLLH